MRNLRWTLDCLPPELRAQAARKLGIVDTPQQGDGIKPSPDTSRQVFAVPSSTPPEGSQEPRRRRGGMYRANPRPTDANAATVLPAPSPAGFKSIAEARAEKKAKKRRKTLTPDMASTVVKSCEVSPDGDEVRLTLNVDPYMLPTAQQKGAFVGKDGRVHFFTKAKVAKSEKALIMALSPYAEKVRRWGAVPISLEIDFCFPFPKSTPKKELIHFSYHLQKPDLDNIEKGLGDSLTQSNFWIDDSLIADMRLRKFRILTEPCIVITIRKLTRAIAGSDLLTEKKNRFFKDIFEKDANTNP